MPAIWNDTATYTWNSWVGSTTNASSTYTWPDWNQTYTTTTTYIQSSNSAWRGWFQDEGYIPGYNAPLPDEFVEYERPVFAGASLARARVHARTEDEWTVIREERERERAQRDVTQREAREEARRLMRVVLSADQMAQYESLGYFEVVGSEGGLFRIYYGTSGNLKQVVNGLEINALCVHPDLTDHRSYEGEGYGYLPTEDCMIAQAFALMHDELGTVATANVHRGQRHLRAVA